MIKPVFPLQQSLLAKLKRQQRQPQLKRQQRQLKVKRQL
jgi:hypothetical protein